MYEITYGAPENLLVVFTDDEEDAIWLYNSAKRTAEDHGLGWTVALWIDGCLDRSEIYY